MLMLGDILAAARRSAGELEAWLCTSDAALLAELNAAAANLGLTTAAYARLAVADFSRLAEEEAWSTLISRLRDAADPGLACLAEMIRWRIAAPGCSAHIHSSPRHDEGTAYGGQ